MSAKIISIELPDGAIRIETKRAFTRIKRRYADDCCHLSQEPKKYPAYMIKAFFHQPETGWATAYVVYLYEAYDSEKSTFYGPGKSTDKN